MREIERVRAMRVRLVAAGHLQSWWRGYIGRRLFMENLREARLRRLRELRRIEAAVQIQTIFRGYVAKIEAETRESDQAAREEALAGRYSVYTADTSGERSEAGAPST